MLLWLLADDNKVRFLVRALIITADGFEDLELFYPYYRLQELEIGVVISAPQQGEVTGKNGYKVRAEMSFREASKHDFDILIIPGGRAPERVRLEPEALEIVRRFFKEDKPVAVICHGPQVLISAGVVRGRRLTSWWGIKDDVIAAGGVWVDSPAVVDGNMVSARYPPDEPEWMRSFIALLRERKII